MVMVGERESGLGGNTIRVPTQQNPCLGVRKPGGESRLSVASVSPTHTVQPCRLAFLVRNACYGCQERCTKRNRESSVTDEGSRLKGLELKVMKEMKIVACGF